MNEIEELKIKHADVLNNPAVKKIAYWRQKNSDVPIIEKEYVERSKKSLATLLHLIKK